ncbi:MAG: hypothetical protein H6672_09740 [Anaerolineaceae bacterium]|nr:hypothetical protein [Anaerolineaceae bacterium]
MGKNLPYGRLAFALVLLAALSVSVTAQDSVTARFTPDNLAPLIGEPVQLALVVQTPAGTTVSWPNFPDDWPPFVVRAVGELETANNGGGQIFQQTLTVILWQPGDYETPDLTLDYQLPGAAEIQHIRVEKAFFSVPSVLDPDDLTLRPLKPPLALSYVSPFLILAIGVIVIAGAYSGWRWRRRSVIRLPRTATASDLHPAAQSALTQIRRVFDSPLSPADSYRVAADALRGYVGGRFSVSASELTTAELIATLEAQPDIAPRRQRELGQMLGQADLVKFAGMQPRSNAARRLLSAAYQWVEQVDRAANGGEKPS